VQHNEWAGRRNWPEAVPRKMRGRKRALSEISENRDGEQDLSETESANNFPGFRFRPPEVLGLAAQSYWWQPVSCKSVPTSSYTKTQRYNSPLRLAKSRASSSLSQSFQSGPLGEVRVSIGSNPNNAILTLRCLFLHLFT
jgi:hypothetical protein